MKKNIIAFLIFIYSFGFGSLAFSYDNLNVGNGTTGTSKQDHLDILEDSDNFFGVGQTGEAGIRNLMFNIARDMRIVMFSAILVLGFIMVFKLLFSSNTEDEVKHFKKWIIWASIGLVVIQIPFSVYGILYDRNVDGTLALSFKDKIIYPFINLLMLMASFMFIAMAIYAFYRIVTANGNEEGLKIGKNTIFQAIAGFILLKIADLLVKNTLSIGCTSWLGVSINCSQNITRNTSIITTFLNWVNSFVALVVVLMIIYAGFMMITGGGGQEEKNKKAKKILLYIFIGLIVLFTNYLILTFFINPEKPI